MTVAVASRKILFPDIEASTGPFSFNFRILIRNGVPQIGVIKYDAAGTPTTLNYPADYTFVASGGGITGGIVTLVVAGVAGESLLIYGLTPKDQPTSYTNIGKFYPEKHEESYDQGILIIQEQQQDLDRSLKFPLADVAPDGELPIAALRANQTFTFDALGNPLMGSPSNATVTVPWQAVVGAASIALGLTAAGFSAFTQTLLASASAAAFRTTLDAEQKIDSLTGDDPALDDYLAFADTSDSDNSKKATIADILALQALPSRNCLINGEFLIWQDGTSFSPVANNSYPADQWQYLVSGAAAHDASRSTDVPTVVQAGRKFLYSLLLDCTTADASLAGTDYTALYHPIEGYNWLAFAERELTLSFWVKATKIGTYCVAIKSGGSDRSFVAEYTVDVTDTWEFKTVTFDASPSAGTWSFTNGLAAALIFPLASGANYHTTPDAWQTGNFFATANQVNATDNTANNFRITGVQLEVGDTASEFESRTWQEEMHLCERYLLKSFNYAIAPAQNAGSANGEARFISVAAGSATTRSGGIPFVSGMRVAPTMTLYNSNAANAQARDLSIGADCSSTVTLNISERDFSIQTVTNASTTATSQLAIHWRANARF